MRSALDRSVKDVTVLWGVLALPSTASDLNKDSGGPAGVIQLKTKHASACSRHRSTSAASGAPEPDRDVLEAATASAKLHFIRSTQSVEVSRFNCAGKGIVAESSEVLICKERGSFSEVLVRVSPCGGPRRLGDRWQPCTFTARAGACLSLIVLGATRSCANASL